MSQRTRLLSVEGLCVDVDGARLLNDVSFELFAGDIMAVLGANGAGKSTLLSVLAGECAPSAGSLSLLSKPLSSYSLASLAEIRALNANEPSVMFALTVADVVALGRPFAVVDAHAIRSALTELDALPWQHREFATLSTGEQLRVQLARSRYQLGDVRGGLWLLDEPCAHLDLAQRDFVLNYLRRIATEQGIAMVMTTHDPSEAQAIADRVLLLRRGEVIVCDAPNIALNRQSLSICYDAVISASAGWGVSVG
ncbi:MAG: ATP-binding cassette domain-containing protein [Burkholderiales bacterium]|nr:MAG: ATP-binding cassette domain-containing protein [Betaproteobacteria bacterium]TAG72784.1 MAG: ATP-binding cassette domain-containing protein [Burkholderiales bacterium]